MHSPLYAAVFALIFIFLSIRVIKQRRKSNIAIGDGDSKNIELSRAIRVHANFAEYVPLALILLYLFEIQITSKNISIIGVHFFGICLLIGRLLHAYGVSQVNEKLRFRVIGMIITFTSILLLALFILLSYLF